MRIEHGAFGPNGAEITEMQWLAGLTGSLLKQSQTGLSADHELQAEYDYAITQTLDAYSRLAKRIAKEESE